MLSENNYLRECRIINSAWVALIVVSVLSFSFSCASRSGVSQENAGLTADSGMVVSAHREASETGVEIMKKGGNAVDAAVATAFALSVCYPEAGNIGGGGFMLIRTADGNSEVIDFREKAPGQASKDMFLDEKGNVREGLSTESALASGVPGSVDGLIAAHTKYGKLPFSEVIQPSIDLAEEGYTMTSEQAETFNYNRENFMRNNNSNAFVKESLWKEGDIFRQHDLAKTLERIRDNGRDGFYSGITARLIAGEMKRDGGLINENDLKEYRPVSRTPLKSDYKGYRLITVPPPSGGGITLLQLLGMVEPYSLENMGFHTAESMHLIIESARRAFADRAEFSGDPDFTAVPTGSLINKKYLLGRMSDFNPDHATPSSEIRHGDAGIRERLETTHFSVADSHGNAVAVTTTLNGLFGNSIVVDSAGFLMNNEMDDFSISPGKPNMFGLIGGEANSVQPGKRMLSSMTPVIVEKNGKLFLVAGSPGGSTIPTTVFQLIINIIDYGMSINEAVGAGRFHHQWLPEETIYESSSFDTAVIQHLKEMGHAMVPCRSLGTINAIMVNKKGQKLGGPDPRNLNSSRGY